jgi:hypothetical protein
MEVMRKNIKETIKVSDNGTAYFARHNGKSASCTAGAKQAAEAVARKLWPEQEVKMKLLKTEGRDYYFTATRAQQ